MSTEAKRNKCEVCGASVKLFWLGRRDGESVWACAVHVNDVEVDEE